MGLSATSTREYVDGLPDELKGTLSDLVATSSGDGHVPRGEGTKRIYDDVSFVCKSDAHDSDGILIESGVCSISRKRRFRRG